MSYFCKLRMGQRVYVDNQGTQTIVTTASSSPGQQQQSSMGFQTGHWTAPPEVLQTPSGSVLKITTAQGHTFIQVQGNHVGLTGEVPSRGFQAMQMHQTSNSPVSSMPPMEPMKPMKPMKPMQPMSMGNMQMTMNPMQMRMGDMEMQMGSPASSGTTSSTQKFCSQCGSSVKPSDRFCSNCGHTLGS